MKLGTIA